MIRSTAGDTTRERILKAAMLRFAAHSYQKTVLRDIAADAGVDMAYVHRSFGSKEKLFEEALRETSQLSRILDGDPDTVPERLAKEVLVSRGTNEIRPFDIFVHSLSSPDAAEVLRKTLSEDFIAPLLESRPHLTETQAGLMAAILLGVGILRDVLRAPGLQAMSGGELEQQLSSLISSLFAVDDEEGERPG
ncbi:hypothetical protein LA66_15025 [Aureimonas altamirensis]|uniref:HTH tetR-type domain-containing protein n=1 Tax=Aureimonas altamirensis TaxID=370622 RepID=A0A0B1Q4Y6_9HYPH|nr:hypothetical protein LA66_15025 [Aureimonas altamirensis]